MDDSALEERRKVKESRSNWKCHGEGFSNQCIRCSGGGVAGGDGRLSLHKVHMYLAMRYWFIQTHVTDRSLIAQ